MATLRNGSSGSSVSDLQKKLNDAGYEPKLSTDGKYGSKTAAAVKWYQSKNGLEADGVAGSATLAKLEGTSADSEDDHVSTAKYNGIPGNPEIWKNSTNGKSYVVYFADGIEPPLPMIWEVQSDRDLESFFGPGKKIVYDKTLSQENIDKTGGMVWGNTSEIVDTEEDPLEGWASRWDRERQVRPYLEDPEVYALYASAALEGRSVTDAELESTEWMRSRSEAERRWIITNASDPLTAQQMLDDNRIATMQRLQDVGLVDVPDNIMNFMADQLTTGMWTTTKFDDQILALSDPASGVPLDSELRRTIGSVHINTTQEGEDRVRSVVTKWLGTNFGQWSDDQVADWAGRIRNDGDAEVALLETLKDQREALFPGYDREADYETIASPWKAMMQAAWGEIPNDSDKELQGIIRLNDAGEAGKRLTRTGLARGNDTVVNTVQTELTEAFGG